MNQASPSETLHIRLPVEIVATLRMKAAIEERSVNSVVARILRTTVEREIKE